MSELSWDCLVTPVGPVSVGCGPAGVARVRFGSPPQGISGSELTDAARAQLAEYFSGQRKSFELPVDWTATSGTQRQVLEVLADEVGYGATVTYGNLAARAGLQPSSDLQPGQKVGQIMGSNPIPVIVPCHRVLASDGLGGYSGGAGIEVKRWLLILEGALPPTLDWEPGDPAA
ncbi:MAG TPA: methylated-DNA--[protein]-cysteine S-methyltransferase [Streptosporangiaceae bacterium]|nr:methylated-DNA--[protein]-cysteine S-methyltransferase [Streptosporangiaceae bacterium]